MDKSSQRYPVSEAYPASDGSTPVRNVTDGAVGVPKWFVAIVNHNAEKSVAERLNNIGFQTYVATQTHLRLSPSGRKRKVEKVMISSFVFIRCSETDRRKIVTLPYINRFLVDRARAKDGLAAPPAIIPQKEIDTLRFMLGQTEFPVTLTRTEYRPGDRVQVIRGALRGLRGEIISDSSTRRTRPSDSAELIIRLDILGTARVAIQPQNLSPIQ
ncbi:MAG: UpxY family transcription antiterminator [Muribaculaceae bacterium]|nr:UpxY family transcription antiterminator [Muribaculaceae bacterium]